MLCYRFDISHVLQFYRYLLLLLFKKSCLFLFVLYSGKLFTNYACFNLSLVFPFTHQQSSVLYLHDFIHCIFSHPSILSFIYGMVIFFIVNDNRRIPVMFLFCATTVVHLLSFHASTCINPKRKCQAPCKHLIFCGCDYYIINC